jgi:hypothetical protein
VNETGKLLLQDLDAFADDGVGWEVSGALDVEVESVRDGIVVKRLPFLRRLLPRGVLAWWPA